MGGLTKHRRIVWCEEHQTEMDECNHAHEDWADYDYEPYWWCDHHALENRLGGDTGPCNGGCEYC